MICKLCKEKESLPNTLLCKECLDKLKYQPKASVLLEGIESGHRWGVARLSPQILFTDVDLNKIDDLDICGTWGFMDDGRLWVHLETPLQALQDKATVLLHEFTERRKKGLTIPQIHKPGESHEKKVRTSAPKPRPVKDQGQEAGIGETTVKEMQRLRALLHPKT
ncbi:MAG: hypothetical protein PHZ19_08880 [Candidatus Thermoplasmatota archaeon]|nr:hypothetical protein [Candidatus Thermoplasmatota archaeon]